MAPTTTTTYGHGYANQRYSGLSQIDTTNVRRLVPKWIYQTGVLGTFPTSPLVADGVMYLTTPGNHVIALDAASGAVVWDIPVVDPMTGEPDDLAALTTTQSVSSDRSAMR